MSAHWHIGMEVECIDDADTEELMAGRVYTITKIGYGDGVFKGRDWCGICISVKEATAYTESGRPHEDGFASSRFRPIQKRKTSIEIFNRILLNPSIKIREDA